MSSKLTTSAPIAAKAGELIDAALASQPIDPIVTAPQRRRQFRLIEGGKKVSVLNSSTGCPNSYSTGGCGYWPLSIPAGPF